jgi:hypothetical protein
MPRTPASTADQELIAYAARQGVRVSARQLERWRALGLLPPNTRKALGRGKGSISVPAPGAAELVAWLGRHARPGRRPGDLALSAFGEGLAVPEATVRTVFAAVATSIGLTAERDAGPDAAPEDIADAVVASGARPTMVPARIRRIDRALQKSGFDWSAPELTAIDPGRSDPRLTQSDWAFAAVQVVLTGGAGIDMGTIGALARIAAPADGAAPLAGQIEYRWPISVGSEPAGLPGDEDVLSLIEHRDLRQQLAELAASAPLTELADGFTVAAYLPQWATGMCLAVEDEINAGRPGPAARDWAISAVGASRMLMTVTLRSQRDSPSSIASTALMLIFIRNMLRSLRRLLPDSNFGLLRNPLAAPSFFADFLDR